MPKWIKELHDAEWLRDAYQIRTVKEIGAMLNCAPSGVSQALKRHGIQARQPGRPSAPKILKDREWLADQYAKHTAQEIGDALGCHKGTVIDAVKALSIPIVNCGRRRRICKYKRMVDENGRIVLEHRYLMEQNLGRKLLPNEHVHHIDGVKDNNALENLIVLTASAHHAMHNHERKDYMKDYDFKRFEHTCEKCGAQFMGGNVAKLCQACRKLKD